MVVLVSAKQVEDMLCCQNLTEGMVAAAAVVLLLMVLMKSPGTVWLMHRALLLAVVVLVCAKQVPDLLWCKSLAEWIRQPPQLALYQRPWAPLLCHRHRRRCWRRHLVAQQPDLPASRSPLWPGPLDSTARGAHCSCFHAPWMAQSEVLMLLLLLLLPLLLPSLPGSPAPAGRCTAAAAPPLPETGCEAQGGRSVAAWMEECTCCCCW
mmetsp:Transcript_24405/g.62975  ORF Transcript_24405/g.62975 Transcript_24405/m.62975 type:complete len:208 (+) Transcript_24405:829-1452(+)